MRIFMSSTKSWQFCCRARGAKWRAVAGNEPVGTTGASHDDDLTCQGLVPGFALRFLSQAILDAEVSSTVGRRS